MSSFLGNVFETAFEIPRELYNSVFFPAVGLKVMFLVRIINQFLVILLCSVRYVTFGTVEVAERRISPVLPIDYRDRDRHRQM